MFQRSGFFVLDKAPGVSSAQAIAQLRKRLSIPKIGHAGTLDPMATGVLVILVNRATRLAEYVTGGWKRYSGTIRFGMETSSDDIWGEIRSESELIPAFAEVERQLEQFRGEISQLPPKVSALKINGQRAYDLERSGKAFELQPRPVRVTRFDIKAGTDPREVEFVVECSKGTYIRALARDLGKACGSFACLSSLRREHSEPFDIQAAKPLDAMEVGDFIPWERAFPGVTMVELAARDSERLRNGDQRLLVELGARPEVRALKDTHLICTSDSHGGAIGLCERSGTTWRLAGYFGE